MDEPTVRHVANLARLRVTDADIQALAGDMQRITDYIAQLSEANVEGVEPTIHPVTDRNAWREDAAQPGLTREQAVANAPDTEQNFFKVPPVIE
jgi:aspartyl-tRNA(Asn)/glutamyl-tRNA(Gln) amidotransferase subunit C